MTKKKLVCVLLVCLVVMVAVFCSAWLFALPANCNVLAVQTYCAKINDTGEIQPAEGEVCLFAGDLAEGKSVERVLRYAAFMLKQLNCTKTNVIPTDAQIVHFRFVDYRPDNYNVLWEEFVAYDFYTKSFFLLREGQWYVMEQSERFDAFVEEKLNLALRYAVWRGQSTYAPEEFVDSNFEDPSFRYNLYWKQSGQWKLDGYNWKMTGFKNTSDRAISSKEEAISRAAEELGYESPVGVTFYDETCGYWMVELYENDASYTGLTGNELYSRLRRTVQTVILDDKGRTVEIYDSLTRYVAFASAGSTSEMN